jgi:hypothetical protein
MKKMPVKLKDNRMPTNKRKDYVILYDYHKRTSGGFVDAIILGTVMFTGFMWFMLLLALK